jgi:hypothetical protein
VPEGLILQSADGGRTLVYAKPAAYPLYVAPFVRLSATRGAQLANALLLALTAVATAGALRRPLGDAAPLWVAVWVFASVAFAYVFWVHSDLFLMCLVALALALIYGDAGDAGMTRDGAAEQPATRLRAVLRHRGLRWALAGGLLAVAVLSRPLYAVVLLPVALAAPRGQRRDRLRGLATGLLLTLVVAATASLAARGTWTSYAGERRSFYGYTGFPRVDPAADDWAGQVAGMGPGTHSWVKPQTFQMGFDARQTGWNLLYYLVGRHVGLLPYFLPLVLGLLAWRGDRGRWALPLAVAVAAAALFWIRPFNFYGGGGAIANRYFLPLYPALWFLAGRSLTSTRARLLWLAPLAAAALAAPFLWPLWRAPRAFPIEPGGGYHHVSATARRWLPFETTLSHLKPSGQEDFHHNGLWVKLLTPSLRAEGDGHALRLAAGERGQLLVGSSHPLAGVRLVAPRSPLDAEGAEPAAPSRRRGSALRLRFAHPRAVHRMWWSDEPFYLYTVSVAAIGAEEDVTFRILPEESSLEAPTG